MSSAATASSGLTEPWDEMVDGSGGLRPRWHSLLGTIAGLGREALGRRVVQLDRIFAEEGVSGLLPGASPVAWRCDPVPLVLGAAEFEELEQGLAQRAQLLDTVLADVYGPQHLLEAGALPPALVYANPAFLRPCRTMPLDSEAPRPGQRLHVYAAELLRGPDGAWRVLADRTADAAGVAYAQENRRALARVLPEIFRPSPPRPLTPFFEAWQDALLRLVPAGSATPGLALLTPGPTDKLWFEHVVLARELSCTLVEAGDLTVRDGGLFLKTLRGLQPVRVLLRRQDGRTLDPLELDARPRQGVTGLLDAMRAGAVRIVNDPGAGFAEAPALAAFLPALARRLLGEDLKLPGIPTVWLGDPTACARVLPELDAWRIRPALDGTVPAVAMASLPRDERAEYAARIEACPADYVATAAVAPSVAPCASGSGFDPAPIVVRMFLMFDGSDWRAMPGGLARTLSEDDLRSGRLPLHTTHKDVWVATDEETEFLGPATLPVPALAIQRRSVDLPSRLADNFFWLGRNLERLESAARLLRMALDRVARPGLNPREAAEMRSLAAALADAHLLDAEAAAGLGTPALGGMLRRVAGKGGQLADVLDEVSYLTELLRDRLTREVHGTISQALRELGERIEQAEPDMLHVVVAEILTFCATVAGLVAENMVRGGGRFFIELGRRLERLWATSRAMARFFEQPGPLEPGLRLTLELCDSVITYRSRYLSALQAGPVLDLVAADEGNPRALAFQVVAVHELLTELAGDDAAPLPAAAGELLADVLALARDAGRLSEREASGRLPARLRALEASVTSLSNGISRQHFALLPPSHSLDPASSAPDRRGMA